MKMKLNKQNEEPVVVGRRSVVYVWKGREDSLGSDWTRPWRGKGGRQTEVEDSEEGLERGKMT